MTMGSQWMAVTKVEEASGVFASKNPCRFIDVESMRSSNQAKQWRNVHLPPLFDLNAAYLAFIKMTSGMHPTSKPGAMLAMRFIES